MRNQATQQSIKRWTYMSKKLSNQAINQPAQKPSKQSRFSRPKNQSTNASSKQCNYVRCSFLWIFSLPPFWLVYLSCFPSQVYCSYWSYVHQLSYPTTRCRLLQVTPVTPENSPPEMAYGSSEGLSNPPKGNRLCNIVQLRLSSCEEAKELWIPIFLLYSQWNGGPRSYLELPSHLLLEVEHFLSGIRWIVDAIFLLAVLSGSQPGCCLQKGTWT